MTDQRRGESERHLKILCYDFVDGESGHKPRYSGNSKNWKSKETDSFWEPLEGMQPLMIP